MKKVYLIVVIAVVGALAAGYYAKKNQSAESHTYQALFASMVNPPDTLTSPRTYNQTLVETTDPTTFDQLAANNGVNGITGIRYDVLPDSFHIQVTVTLAGDLSDQAKDALRTALQDYLTERSDTLATALFYPETALQARVVFTKEMPVTTDLGGNPTVAALYGLIAGALFGWFLGMGLDKKTR